MSLFIGSIASRCPLLFPLPLHLAILLLSEILLLDRLFLFYCSLSFSFGDPSFDRLRLLCSLPLRPPRDALQCILDEFFDKKALSLRRKYIHAATCALSLGNQLVKAHMRHLD